MDFVRLGGNYFYDFVGFEVSIFLIIQDYTSIADMRAYQN